VVARPLNPGALFSLSGQPHFPDILIKDFIQDFLPEECRLPIIL